MKKVAFVTGGTGFLGHHLVALLAAQGWDVVALVRSRQRARGLNARLVEGDLSLLVQAPQLVPDRVDAFFHVAANISMWRHDAAQQRLDNVTGTQHALEAALAARAQRFVFTSTSAVWGLQHASFDETSERLGARADIPYIQSKLDAEQLVRDACGRGLPCVILNPGHIVGSHDHAGWSSLFARLQSGASAAAPPGIASWCHAPAVARAQLAAVSHGELGANYLLGGADATYLTVLQTAARLLGRDPPHRTVPALALKAVARLGDFRSRLSGRAPEVSPELARILCGRLLFSSSRAERQLGYAPDTLEHMLAACHRWLVEENRLSAAALRHAW